MDDEPFWKIASVNYMRELARAINADVVIESYTRGSDAGHDNVRGRFGKDGFCLIVEFTDTSVSGIEGDINAMTDAIRRCGGDVDELGLEAAFPILSIEDVRVRMRRNGST